MKKILIFLICFLSFISYTFAYTKAPVDITKMNIYEIQQAIDNGYLTYESLTKMYLERIETYDKDFHSIITINDKAIEEAKEKDIEYQQKGRTSILFGIPIVVKDNIDVYGMPTTAGSKTLKNSYPKEDAKIIKKLKEQGIIILAKTNMSEFAFYASNSVSSYGTIRNAYNTAYTSYGSSGGTAVAVSLQFATLGIGTDTNASLRVPSSTNNVIGFRPSLGLLSGDGIIKYDVTRDTVGAITKTVEENAILLENMTDDTVNYTNNIKNATFKDMKVGVLTQFLNGDNSGIYGTGSTYSEIKKLMNDAISKMEEQGAEIVEIDNFFNSTYSKIESNTVAGWTMCYAFNNYIKNTSSNINNFYELTSASGHIYSLWGYASDCTRNISRINDYENIKEPYDKYVKNIYSKYDLDVLIYPTTKNKVLKIGEDEDNFESPSYSIAPVLGYPALSIGLGNDNNGLYYGMDVVGLKNSEETLYQFAYLYEQINNTYILSDLAQPLYEVPEIVKKLKNLYEQNQKKSIILKLNFDTYKEYKKIEEQTEDFLFNYNDYAEEKQTAINLYDKYKNITDKLEKSINVEIIIVIILGGLSLIILFIKKIKTSKNKNFKKIKFKNKKKIYNK